MNFIVTRRKEGRKEEIGCGRWGLIEIEYYTAGR